MRFRLFLPSLALALTIGFPTVSVSVAAEGAPEFEHVVIDSTSSAAVSVSGTSAPLEIVLLSDSLEYQPVHPDLAADRSEDVTLTDPAGDLPAEPPADHP